MSSVDISNKFGVGLAGRRVQLVSPPRGPFSARDAYLLAAYLVAAADAVADPSLDGTFQSNLDSIEVVPDKSAA